MPFSEAVKMMLYARSGNRCAHPHCNIPLVFALGNKKGTVNHGKAAHIVAESKSGPRGKNTLSRVERNAVENGIILCTNHHTDVVDKFPKKFSITQLRTWKSRREAECSAFSAESSKTFQINATYAEYVDRWSELASLDWWYSWTAPLLRSGNNCFSLAVYHRYIELCSWLASRVWPGKFRKLEDSFENFRRVAVDFILVFERHSEARRNMVCTERFYRDLAPTKWKLRRRALRSYEFHTALVEDLLVELTRAANLVCQRVRETLDAQFRLDEGHLVIESGIYEDVSFRRHIVRYSKKEATRRPYPGLLEFMKMRSKRDLHFGKGVRKDYTP
jgi:hypothetical protein